MKKFLLFTLLLCLTCTVFISESVAQGVTTAAINGLVTDDRGEPLPGAAVVAVHTPSGSKYTTLTNQSGRYFLPNMRVGGPYTIKVTFVGLKEYSQEGINLTLGQATKVDLNLAASSNELAEVVVSGNKNDLLRSDRTGASTSISTETIQSIPTINRGLRDFTKLSPLANTSGSGTSFAGTNNRYNQFAIDGIVNNDVFGLSGSGTNGGQTGIEPISLDAIEQFQINIAPFDVRQGGFTGGGINAVTRSGTNTFEGSAYYFGNNQSLVGQKNPTTGVKAKYPDYKDYQLGFRLGGPIIKNRLFFFVNGELTENSTPLAFDPTVAGSGSLITMEEINRVVTALDRIAPGYDPGSYGNISDEVKSRKVLAKIDWNINSNHKLSFRHSYAYGENVDNSRGNNTLRFSNHGQYFPSTTNSSALELSSTFDSRFSNNLLIGYTSVRDDRDPLGSAFPEIRINNLSGGGSITLGSEYSSVANQLDQDIFSITDNFSWYKGKHTLTLGTNNEFYSFYNLFAQNIYGNYAYRSIADFEKIGTPLEVAPTYYAKSYSFDPTDDPSQSNAGAKFSAMQLGLYAQDEFLATPNLKLTLGIRADLPIFNDTPPNNEAFAKAYGESLGISTDQLPKNRVLWSPRFGFNWDVMGDNTFKIRGGTGIFTGRVPFVWVSNQYTNNGTVIGSYSIGRSANNANPLPNASNGTPYRFNPDPFTQPDATAFGGNAGVGAINITDRNFKMPQTFRSNVGIDKELPGGIVATVEGIFSKGINNVTFENLNRQVNTSLSFTGADKRPIYTDGRLNNSFDEIILLKNSSKGYSYNLVAQLQKQFLNGIAGSVAYTYGKSKDLNSGTSSTAYSNWRYLNNVNGPNATELGIANFDVRHRISAYVTYRKEFFKDSPTMFSLFYNGQSGQPLSYLYNGDLNDDGTSNDMIYVPASSSEIALVDIVSNGVVTLSAAEQWANLNEFIEGDSYLKERRGKYAERNGARLPFQHNLDFRVTQDLGLRIGNSLNKLQLSFDVMNVGNLLNKDWGKSYFVSNQGFSLINSTGNVNAAGAPTFTYNGAGQTDGEVYSISDLSSRWRAQIGVRYIFNR